MSLLFNMLSRLVITFFPRSKHLLISWLQSPSAVILEPKKIKSATVYTVSPSICHEVVGPDAMILVFWMLCFKPTFSLSSFTFIKRLFGSSSLSINNLRYADDKARQHIKKQRHHSAYKGLYSLSYGLCSSHVQMWELDHKEGWAPKNWYFQTVVLEKTLEPLGQKGDQTSQS